MAGLHIIVVCSNKKRSRFSFNRMIFHIDYVLAFFSDDWNISSDLARDDADELIVCIMARSSVLIASSTTVSLTLIPQ